MAAAGQDNSNAEELELMMISMDMTIISDDYPKILGSNLKNPSSDRTVSSFNRVRLQVSTPQSRVTGTAYRTTGTGRVPKQWQLLMIRVPQLPA
jgi:hypothetical protein